MRLLLFISLILFSSLPARSGTEAGDAVTGIWNTRDKQAKIQIYRSGQKYYGKIVWMQQPLQDGKPKTDVKNPDPAKRKNPILGIMLLHDFAYDADDREWRDGKIYNPQDGKEYSALLKLKNHNTLEVRGYVGFSLLGRTETWTRAE